jgi:hypothetical protein
MTQQQTLETMSGKVSQVARNKDTQEATGIKIEGREEVWLNFSQYPKGPMETPERGDSVKLGVSRDKQGRWWIGTCEIQSEAHPRSTYEDGHVPAGGRDLSITRSVAIKAAADVVVALIGRGAWPDMSELTPPDFAIDICAIAQDLERWMLREDVPFQ